MSASQLRVLDDRTDLKAKCVKKSQSMVALYELSSLFVKILICDALPSHNLFNDMVHSK